jgi:apolipoprotein N-acyltransferase
LAFAGGAVMVLSFAPFGLYPFAVLALALFYQAVHRQRPRTAFGLGWLFGLGLFGFGVFWIRISLNEFGNMSAPVANSLMLVFVALMAVFCGVAGWSIQRLQPSDGRPLWVGPLLVLPSVWMLLEWVRGWLFTGFPWLLAGNGQINALPVLGAPLAGLAPVLGVHGMGLAVAVSAGLLWGGVRWRAGARRAALVALALLWLGSALLGRIEWTRPDGEPLSATVVQGNVEQSIKWESDGLLPTLQIYLELTREHLGNDLIVWPETAIPDFLHQVQQSLIEPLSETARESGSEIVIGVPIMESIERYYNGLISIGSVDDRYYKRHLVPFGEFLPLKTQLRPLIDWFEVPMSDFSRGSAERPLLQVGEHAVGVSICYEDVFPEQVRQALPDAAYLINVSNDAWFGDSLAPHQHLEFARLRALENGRPLVRATNSGISAIIDHRGALIGSIPSFVRDTRTAEIQPRAGMTPFSRFGNRPTLLVAAAMLITALVMRRRTLPVGKERRSG